ncbi:MAG: VWA domain-containing protein [Gammaproteobacteria bacterium]|nr:VWA domain-containing protein [Gammaproteobacteria bacterium]
MRPTAALTPFAARNTIVLVLDVSASMRAADIAPSRLAAAKTYAKQLVADHADSTRFGLVSFAGTAIPEADVGTGREELLTAIERLDFRPGTALGSGIESALAMLFPDAPLETLLRTRANRDSGDLLAAQASGPALPARRTPGSNAATAIVLMSDGQSTADLAPAAAVQAAADLGVRIHTIGIGSIEGAVLRSQGWSMRVTLDERALQDIARTTAGEYLKGSSRMDWQRLLDAMRPEPPAEDTYTEVTALFAAIAALSATAGALASLFRTQRVL